MIIEVAERAQAAVNDLLAAVNAGTATSVELREVLGVTRSTAATVNAAQTAAAELIARRERHGDGGVEILASSAGLSQREAHSQVKTAQTLSKVPKLRDAVQSGDVPAANARNLADAITRTSSGAVADDDVLLAQASTMRPEVFARATQRWIQAQQADNGASEYERQRAMRFLKIYESEDGMVNLRGQFDKITGQRISNRLRHTAAKLFNADKKLPQAERREFTQCMADALDHHTTSRPSSVAHAASGDGSASGKSAMGRDASGKSAVGKNAKSDSMGARSDNAPDSDNTISNDNTVSGNTGSDNTVSESSEQGAAGGWVAGRTSPVVANDRCYCGQTGGESRLKQVNQLPRNDDVAAAASADYWVDKIQSIRRFASTKKDTRAPYKPLLLLWLIGRLAAGLPAGVSFKEAEPDLKRLMHRHRIGHQVRVGFPFVYLGSSQDLWRVQDSSGNDVFKMPQSTKESPIFLRKEAVGTLTPEFELALHDPYVRSRVVNALLTVEFPETLHEEILQEVNLGHLIARQQSPRDPRFKSTVLQAYEDRCSFCGYDLRLGGSPVGIDAAHVQMRSQGGPDRIENGLALCVQHHRLFDFGALGLDQEHRIMVSEQLNLSDQESAALIKNLVGSRIRRPLRRYRLPAPEHIDWHNKNLFKHPAR